MECATVTSRLSSHAREIAEWLREDGILNWNDVLRAQGISPRSTKSTAVTAPEQQIDPRVRLRELGAGDDLVHLLGKLWPHLEAILEENQSLKNAATQSAEEIGQLRRELESIREFSSLLEVDNERLEMALRDARERLRHAHSAALEEIAAENPDIPQLTVLAQQMKKSNGRQRSEVREQIIARLPKSFKWQSDSGSIQYNERVIGLLVEMPVEDRERVVKQFEMLATHGLEHPSLHTRKYDEARLPFTPLPCFGSRATDELRFTWTKNGGVTVHWLYRKGDSRIRQSEG